MIDPEGTLDQTERIYLATVMQMPGFKVLQKIMRAEVDKFFIPFINTSPAKKDDVIAAHTMLKAATQFYQQVINRLNVEQQIQSEAPRGKAKPVDITAGILDIDAVDSEEFPVNLHLPDFLDEEGIL